MTAPIIPEAAIQAADNAIADAVGHTSSISTVMLASAALTAAAPFLRGVRPSSFVNDAGITAADMPHIVVQKLDAAYEARIGSQIETGIPATEPSPRAQALEECTKWHRDDGAYSILIYSLRQDGYRKGAPSMINDVMVRIEKSGNSDANISDIATQIHRALSSQPVADGWLPIETAPKDGTEIILSDGCGSFAGFYHDGSQCRRAEAGFFFESDRDNLLTAKNITAVMWRPLPSSPEVSG